MALRRKNIEVEIKHIELSDLEGPLLDAVTRLQDIATEVTHGHSDVRVEWDPSCSDDYDIHYDQLIIKGTRPETDRELARRQKTHDMVQANKKKAADAGKAKRKIQYEKLKKEFE